MTTNQLLHALQDSTLGLWVRKSDHLVGAGIQVFHIIGLILLLTATLVLTLRLFGQGLRKQLLPELALALAPLFWIGYALIVISGVLMFIGNAVIYFDNPAFQAKMIFFALATLIQLVLFAFFLDRLSRLSAWLKIAAGFGFSLWLAVGLAGRAIGFV